MKSFLKYTLATIVGILITSIILFFFFIGILSAVVSKQSKPVTIDSNSILVLKLNKPIQDRKPGFSFSDLNFQLESDFKLGLNNILENIDKAKTDDKIKGIFLDLSIIPAGLSTIDEIRNALIDFKTSGKFVISYADYYNQPTYYLASVSDKIYLNPEGFFYFVGMRAEVMFFKGALEKLGIEPQIIRHGKFKSAVEPLMLDKMSEENRLQIKTYVGSIWSAILANISDARNIPVSELNKFADNVLSSDSENLLKYKLIDGLVYKDEVIDELKSKAGIAESRKLKTTTLSQYSKVPKVREYKGLAKDKIAVIYATGSIIFGDETEQNIGSEGISKAIQKARKDSSVKAIVLRINSGGGNAIASEVIWREMQLASEAKPVVASFGDMAASGGYYIACPADTIIANSLSLTGSIGVFGVIPNSKKLLNNKLGITIDVESTNTYSDFMSIYRPLKPFERQVMQKMIDTTYNTFINHVASGRSMNPEEVDKIGEGRVWSGINAMDIGLIDLHGGLTKAIETAAQMAGLDKYRIMELPKLEDPFQKVLKDLSENVSTGLLKKELGEAYKHYEYIKELKSMEGIQARIPYVIDVY
ncbi:MAG: signal peptide peptidase SppA [Bacteroidales bacterium]|nr:signal peptide peptidase SppA [Bacteroidales bacterium]